MTGKHEEERQKFLRRLFGDRPEPVDSETDADKTDPELRRLTRNIFNRA